MVGAFSALAFAANSQGEDRRVCGVKRNSPKGRLALNTVIGFHRIIVIVVVIIVLFILHILHIAQRGEWTHVVRIKSGSRGRGPSHREFNPKYTLLKTLHNLFVY